MKTLNERLEKAQKEYIKEAYSTEIEELSKLGFELGESELNEFYMCKFGDFVNLYVISDLTHANKVFDLDIERDEDPCYEDHYNDLGFNHLLEIINAVDGKIKLYEEKFEVTVQYIAETKDENVLEIIQETLDNTGYSCTVKRKKNG